MDRYLAISNTGFFRDLSEQSRRGLAEVCFHSHVQKKEIVFQEGDPGLSIFLLASGTIQLSKAGQDGASVVIKLVQPGELFAEVVLFEAPAYPVTATALNDSLVFRFPKDAIHTLLSQETFRNDFIAVLLRKQRYLTQRIYSLTSMDPEQRLFQFLDEHYGESRSIEISISRKDIAAAIGIAPETLSRLIQRLEQEGQLSWKGKKIELT